MSENTYGLFFELYRQARAAGLRHEDHHELVAEYSDDRTRSLRDLSPKEYAQLCYQLRDFAAKDAEANDRMRKKLIGLLKGCGYALPDGTANMPAIYTWVEKSGYLKKKIMAYTRTELPRLVYQAEQLQRSFVKHLAGK